MLSRRVLLQRMTFGGLLLATGCASVDAPPVTLEVTPNFATPSETPPVSTPDPSPTPVVDAELEAMIGQLFMVGFRGLAVDENHPIVRDIVERNLGGVVLFDYDFPNREYVRNIESAQQLGALTAALQSYAETPLLIAIDQEGGVVARLSERWGFPPTFSHFELGAADDTAATYEHARQIAATLKSVGVNHNLAPVVDVNVNPNSPAIGAYGRSFSTDPDKVVDHAAAYIQAHHDEGVITTLKHFPGHGSAMHDSHRGFVDVTDTWSSLELEPYARLIEQGLADTVMTAHVFNEQWDSEDPATLSSAVITDILRTEMGFKGVVISDDMQMKAIDKYYSFEEAIPKSLEAGVDVIAIANNSVYNEEIMAHGVEVVKGLVRDGVITRERIEESYNRIQALKARYLAD